MCVDKSINIYVQDKEREICRELVQRKEREKRREEEEERKKRGELSLPKNLYIIQRVDPRLVNNKSRQELNLGEYHLTCVNSTQF